MKSASDEAYWASVMAMLSIIAFYWGGGLISSVFEPYLGCMIFFLLYALFCIRFSRRWLRVISVIALGIILFAQARLFHANELEFYSNEYLDDYPFVPCLPHLYWGWGVQAVIITVTAFGVWKVSPPISKTEKKE